MYAVILKRKGAVIRLIGFANTPEQCQTLMDECIEHLGGEETAAANGYYFSVELAG